MCTDDSGLREAVLQLTDTILQLKGAVEKLATKDEDPDEIPTRVAEEEGWETARDTLQDQTKETADAWKDELNNLLVFAGLFSAVVTAFTVESYTWLQQDSGDVSNTLLAQISTQLSAFTLGSTFLNSTSPALPLSNVTASYSPISYAVSVNTLWVLSLTLSLISAFFAITAQQWLRQLRLPPDMPVRMAIRLMAVRSDALQAWQVPSIISLLPLLLQVAVIFFLIGLFLLLQALNATVAVAFGIVTLVGLIAFLATTFIPLLAIYCPYKSPVIPTGAILLQSLSYPLALAVTPIVLGLKVMLQQLPEFIRIRQRYSMTSRDMFDFYNSRGMQFLLFRDGTMALRRVLAVGAFYEFSLVSYIKSFGRHMFVDIGRFWLSREYQYLASQEDGEHERSSLISVALAAPSRSFSKVLPCLRGFDDRYRYIIARGTVERSLRAIVPRQYDVINSEGQLGREAKPYARKWLSSRHRRLLWWLLRQRNWTQDREVGWGDSELLTLTNEIDGAEFVTPRRFVKHLLHVCHNQHISERRDFREIRPACLLLHCIQSSSYILNEQDVEGLHQVALRVFDRDFAVNGDTCELVLASGALLLHALNGEGAARSYHLSATVLSALSAFLYEEGATLWLGSLIEHSYSDRNADPEYMRASRLIINLCAAAAQYSSHLDLTLPAYSLSRISAVLRAVCSDSDYEGQTEMVEARGFLDVIDNNIGTVHFSIGWELLAEGWDGYLAALVIAQDMERVTEESILESAMESFLLAETRFLQPTAPDQGNDQEIDQHTDSSADASWKALGPCTRVFKIASAMPPPGRMNHVVDEEVIEE